MHREPKDVIVPTIDLPLRVPQMYREVVGSFFSLPPATQRAYLPYAPDFFRRKYRRLSQSISSSHPVKRPQQSRLSAKGTMGTMRDI
jgi:hypothetical protein